METVMSRDLTLLLSLPDGRILTVKYTYNGLVADVTYEGTTKNPQRPGNATQPLSMPLPQPTMPMSSLCFVNIYLLIIIDNNKE